MTKKEIFTLTQSETNTRLMVVSDEMRKIEDRKSDLYLELSEEFKGLKHHLWMLAKSKSDFGWKCYANANR